MRIRQQEQEPRYGLMDFSANRTKEFSSLEQALAFAASRSMMHFAVWHDGQRIHYCSPTA